MGVKNHSSLKQNKKKGQGFQRLRLKPDQKQSGTRRSSSLRTCQGSGCILAILRERDQLKERSSPFRTDEMMAIN